MSKLPIFELFISVGNLKPKLKWFFKRNIFLLNFHPAVPPRGVTVALRQLAALHVGVERHPLLARRPRQRDHLRGRLHVLLSSALIANAGPVSLLASDLQFGSVTSLSFNGGLLHTTTGAPR